MILDVNKEYAHEFCMECGIENPQTQEICNCGSRHFIFGDHINLVDKQIICDCGGKEFQMTISLNMSPFHNTTFVCNCGKHFGMQTYIE